VWGGRITECFHKASRKDLIARLPLRLWPAKMTVFFATSHRMASIDAFRQHTAVMFFFRIIGHRISSGPDLQTCFNIHRNLTHSLGNARTCKFSSSNLIFSPNSFSIGVFTSKWGVRVRRFCGFVAGGAVTQGVVGGLVWCV